MSIALTGATLVTGNPNGEILNDAVIVVENDCISDITSGTLLRQFDGELVDARGCTIIPGFVQTHVHLCQTMFRGMADDLSLLDWQQRRIFPFEAAHSARSMYSSALLGVAELIRSGTTTILDMGSIEHQEEIIRAVGETGIRAFVGKAMMDVNDLYPQLRESTANALSSTRSLIERWHTSFDGRIRYALAPRFVLSCSDELLHGVKEMLESFEGVLFHTHASENPDEVKAVRARCRMENIEFLNHLGLLSDRACLAHCIHISEKEVQLLSGAKTSVAHCPSSNSKLGSGIARIPHLLNHGVNVSLGADGAPCNNTLDMFQEMRLASFMQKPLLGATAMPAKTVFEMATMAGAKALGMHRSLGSLEVGKKADMVLLRTDNIWDSLNNQNIYSAIVYSMSPENVDSVMIDGKWVYRNREFVNLDAEKVVAEAKTELEQLLRRVHYN